MEFASEEDAKAALDYHKKLIGTRYVEVFKCYRSDMARAVNPSPTPSNAGGVCIPSILSSFSCFLIFVDLFCLFLFIIFYLFQVCSFIYNFNSRLL